jgi:hypothetical protein
MHAHAERSLPLQIRCRGGCANRPACDQEVGTTASTPRLFFKVFRTLGIAIFFAGMAIAQEPPPTSAGSVPPPADPRATVSAPTDASQGNSANPQSAPKNAPNVLDGLESLQLAKEPDFGPPIVDANDLYQGRSTAGAAGSNSGNSAFMKPLEANLTTPDLTAPTLQTGPDANLQAAPNQRLPMLEMPDTFGPTMTGLPAYILGQSLQQRPLGTIGTPTFLSAKRSFPIGNSRVRYGVELDAGVAYNNNVFGASNNTKGDIIMTLQPTFYLETGKKGTMQFLWTPSFVQYAKYKQLNSMNQTFVFSSRYRWTKLRVGLDASYLAQSGLFLNSQGQSQQKAVFARLFAGYALTKKTEALFNFDASVTDSNPGGKQYQATFTTSIDYKYSRKTSFGGAIALGYSSSSAGTTTSESFLLRLLYNPTSKLVFRGEGGLQFRQSMMSNGGTSSSAVTSVMNLSLQYRPSSKTYVSLHFFRNVDMDAFNAGNLQITTSLETIAAWRITHSTSMDLALGAGHVENVGLSGQNTGTYNFVQANLGLSYMISSEVNLKLFNNLQQKVNDTHGNNYMSNTSGMSLGMRF